MISYIEAISMAVGDGHIRKEVCIQEMWFRNEDMQNQE
jgi:hypothetical protein